MTTVGEVCHYVRSKNAGPFWVTFDLFFKNKEAFDRYSRSPAIGPDTFKRLFGADPELVKSFPVESLEMVKISCVRPTPSGSRVERDLHSGQMFVRLLDIELD
ncbi:DUF4387 domain-containing protein [Sphingobium sp. SCG-1]|uniref:DUF4387 domain-containing protein n=1 Tax=Sphingobium sp. SCG-1 TaxID=2072936 RepID=UPI000CD6B94C|nr:DUF4387 domain-containing protein [Sphingobium sp. SCG-1]AUW57003.1 DUF4387 domain-containing protein [Sphingobium sp. SCG-1]